MNWLIEFGNTVLENSDALGAALAFIGVGGCVIGLVFLCLFAVFNMLKGD